MSSCKCGAQVTYVQVQGETIPLENYEISTGKRFGVVDFTTQPWTAEPQDPTSLRVGHADHRESCPMQQ